MSNWGILRTLLVYEMFYSLSSLLVIMCSDTFWRLEAFEITISKAGQGSLEKWSWEILPKNQSVVALSEDIRSVDESLLSFWQLLACQPDLLLGVLHSFLHNFMWANFMLAFKVRVWMLELDWKKQLFKGTNYVQLSQIASVVVSCQKMC